MNGERSSKPQSFDSILRQPHDRRLEGQPELECQLQPGHFDVPEEDISEEHTTS